MSHHRFKQRARLEGHKGAIWNCKFSPNGNYCMTCGHDRTVRLWNPFKGAQIASFVGHSYEVFDVTITKDNARFASCGKERTLLLWDVDRASDGPSRRIRAHEQPVNAITFNEPANVLVSASADRKVAIWDLLSHQRDPIQVLDDAEDSVSTLLVKDHTIFTGSIDGNVRCYDVRMGKLKTDQMHSPVTHISLSHDGNCVLVSTSNSTVRIMATEDGTLYRTYEGHKNSEYVVRSGLTFDDALVVSGSEDDKIYIWDMVDNNIVQTLTGHTGIVSGLTCHPEENILLSSSVDGTLRLWK